MSQAHQLAEGNDFCATVRAFAAADVVIGVWGRPVRPAAHDAAFEAISNAKHASCMVFSALDVFGPFMRKRTVLFIVHNYGNPTPTEHGLFQPSCRGSSARLADCHQSAHCARVTWVSAVSARPSPLRANERAGNGAVIGVKVWGGQGVLARRHVLCGLEARSCMVRYSRRRLHRV